MSNVIALKNMASALAVAGATGGARALGGKQILKLSKHTGEWVYGKDAEPLDEPIAVNISSFQWGYVLWSGGGIVVEHMVPVSEPQGDSPGGYNQQRSFDCAGVKSGVQMVYKTSALGGVDFWADLATAISQQLKTDPEHPVPVIELSSTFYMHKQNGKIYKPTFEVLAWRAIDDTSPVEEEEEPDPAPTTAVRKRIRR